MMKRILVVGGANGVVMLTLVPKVDITTNINIIVKE